MMLKTVIAAALFALFGFAIAESAANELANKGIECAGRCGSHHHHRARCCGCPKKGSIAKVTKLNEILLNLFFTQNPQFMNLIDMAVFQANVQGGLQLGPNFCCAGVLNFAGFISWLNSFGTIGYYPIFEEGEHAYEVHSNGCIVVPFDMVSVGPASTKDALADPATVTRAYKVKVTWCPAEGCNWKVTAMDVRSFACLNTTHFVCPI